MFLFTGITIQEVFRQTKDLEEPCCDKVMKTLCPWFKEWCDTLDPSFSFSATTINRYSSIVTPASNNPNPTNSSDKYHKCRLNAVVTAFITSFFWYVNKVISWGCCRHWALKPVLGVYGCHEERSLFHGTPDLRPTDVWWTSISGLPWSWWSRLGWFLLVAKQPNLSGIHGHGHPASTVNGSRISEANSACRTAIQEYKWTVRADHGSCLVADISPA